MNMFSYITLLLSLSLNVIGASYAQVSQAFIQPDASITTIRDVYEKPVVEIILTKAPAKKHPSQLATLFNHYWATHASVIKDWYVSSTKRTLTENEVQVQKLIEEITLKEWAFEAYNRDEEVSVPFIASSVNLFDAVDTHGNSIFRTALTTGMLDVFALNTAATQKQATPIMNRLIKNLQETPGAAQYQNDISTLAAGLPEFKLNELPWLNLRKAAAIAGAVTVAATTAFCGKKLHTYIKTPRAARTPTTPSTPTPATPAPVVPTPTPAPANTRAPMVQRDEAGVLGRLFGNVPKKTRVARTFEKVVEHGPAFVENVGNELSDAAHVTSLVGQDIIVRGHNALVNFASEPERVVATAQTSLELGAQAAPYYLMYNILGFPGVALTAAGDIMRAARERIVDPAAPAGGATPEHTALITRNNQRRAYLGVGTLAIDKTRLVSCAAASGYIAVNTLPWILSYATGSDAAYWLTLGTEFIVPTVLAVKNAGAISNTWNWVSNQTIFGQTIGERCRSLWNRFKSLNPDNLAGDPAPVPGAPVP
jgi:hypothetical protein